MLELDSLVISRVLAAAASGRFFLRQTAHSTIAFASRESETGTYACCAVGAGCLFAGASTASLEAFMRLYECCKDYACAVSDGFEGRPGVTGDCNYDSDEYTRGYRVGEIIAAEIL